MSEQRPQPTEPRPERDTIDQLKLAGAAIGIAALVIFFFQNLQDVEVHFLGFDWQTDMIWALIASAALGGLIVFFAMWFGQRRERRPPER